jgi:carbamoyltransferase
MGLAPYGRPNSVRPLLELKDNELHVPEWDAGFNQPWMPDGKNKWEASPAMRHWEDMAWRIQHDAEEVLIARALAARDDRRQEPGPRRRRGAQLRRQRTHRARGGIR